MIWQSNLLSQFTELIHGSTSNSHGVLRWSDAPEQEVKESRRGVAEKIGVDPERMILLKQEHGDRVYVAREEHAVTGILDPHKDLPTADGAVTALSGITLIINTSDCVPILFYDPVKRVIGGAHAGWQGTYKKVVQEVLKTMKNEYKCDTSDIFVAIGPAISGQNYDISQANDGRLQKFETAFGKASDVICRTQNRVALDLPLANKKLCLDMGIPENQIEMSGICTFEQADDWASFRKDPKALATPIWSCISIKR